MNLRELNGGTTATKTWLNPVFGSLTTGLLNTDGRINITDSTASTSQTTGALVVAGGVGVGGTVYAGSLFTTPSSSVIQTGNAFRMDNGTGASCNLQLLRTDTNRWSFTNNVASSTLFNVYSAAPENSASLISSYVFGRSAGATSSGQLAYAYNGVDVATANAGGNLNKISLCHVGTACDLDLFRDGSMYVNSGQLRYDQGNKAGVGNNGLKILDTTASTSSTTGALQVSGGIGLTGKINGFSPIGGVFSQTSDLTVANTAIETSIVGTGVGVLSIPANGFKVGDSFMLHLNGNISNLNNTTLTLKVYGGVGGGTLLDTVVLTLVPTATGKQFHADVHFVVRAIGAAGVGQLSTFTSYDQTTNTGGGTFQAFSNDLNTTTFDTTDENIFDFTVQFGLADVGNTITSTQLILEKIH